MTAPAEVSFETAVARSLAGQDIGRDLTRAEKSAVARALAAKNYTNRAIGFHLGVHEDAVPRLLNGRPAKKGSGQ